MNLEIRTWTTYGDAALVQLILSAPGIEVIEVELNTSKQVPREDTPSKEWPLIIRCASDNPEARKFEIRVYGMTSGYAGSGPSDLVGCLEATGVKFDKEEIYLSEKIQKKYRK